MANRRGRIYRRTTKDPTTGELVETGPFWIQFWFNGKDRRESSHSTNRRVAEKLLTKRMAGKDDSTLDEADLKSKRFEDLQAAIERDYRLNNRASFDRMQDAFQALASKFAGWKTSAITNSRLSEYVDERIAIGRAHATVLYELRVLKYAFRLAKVPCPDFPTIVPNNVRKEWFSQDEFRAVVDRLPLYLQPVMTAAYLMGWRTQSELLSLQWKNVDFKSGLITLPVGSTKNGDGREYPIGQFPELLALFQARWEATQQLQGHAAL